MQNADSGEPDHMACVASQVEYFDPLSLSLSPLQYIYSLQGVRREAPHLCKQGKARQGEDFVHFSGTSHLVERFEFVKDIRCQI